MIDAGAGTAIWCEERQGGLSFPQDAGAPPALKGLAAQESGLKGTLLNRGCCFQLSLLGQNVGTVTTGWTGNAVWVQSFSHSSPCSLLGFPSCECTGKP